jgi:hypothetical protein
MLTQLKLFPTQHVNLNHQFCVLKIPQIPKTTHTFQLSRTIYSRLKAKKRGSKDPDVLQLSSNILKYHPNK